MTFLLRCFIPLTIIAALGRPAASQAQTFNAEDPASSGYALKFDDEFNNPASIDINATNKPGFKWYPRTFYRSHPTEPADISVANGVLTLNGPTADNGSLGTAAPGPKAGAYVGSVFGGGGYFEASIAFDKTLIDKSHGFPAFWSMAVEHMAFNGKSQWPGQDEGFEHFIEIDFFEADTFDKDEDSYSGAVHDWYGKWTKQTGIPGNLTNRNYIIHVPHHTDFKKFHRYGCLVVPSSEANNWCGYIQYFFDGLPTSDIVTWSGGHLPGTPPPTGDDRFAIADTAHLNVLLGCGAGDSMRVKYVRVWQLPYAAAFAIH